MKLITRIILVALACHGWAFAAAKEKETMNPLYSIPLKTIAGQATTLAPYKGKVLLLVNVASKCGHTPQYAGLEKLHQQYKDKGLQVLGFPCNDFGGQEPGTNEEIVKFCSMKYNVSFPLFDKLHAKGPDQHPLYGLLTGKTSPTPGEVGWNFEKFLVGRDGTILARFKSSVKPDAPELIAAIEKALGQ